MDIPTPRGFIILLGIILTHHVWFVKKIFPENSEHLINSLVRKTFKYRQMGFQNSQERFKKLLTFISEEIYWLKRSGGEYAINR